MFKQSWRAAGVALALWGLAGLGNQAAAQVIVDTAQVQEALKRPVQVWDVRGDKDFAKGHLPGALSVGDAAAVLRDANTEDFTAAFGQRRKMLRSSLKGLGGEALCAAAGIDPAKETVVYGSRGTWNPYFGRYALRYFGGTKVSVYHEGIEGWQAAGGPVEAGAAKPTPIALTLAPNPAVAVSTQEVLARLGKPDMQIVDARTPKEFAGADIRALRGGHIPGAVNIPYEMNWSDPETLQKLAQKSVGDNRGMSLKAPPELQALYARLDPDKETVVYCWASGT
jgi:thiosulfate/3-mercaptopyruvate sulfurtransferase